MWRRISTEMSRDPEVGAVGCDTPTGTFAGAGYAQTSGIAEMA